MLAVRCVKLSSSVPSGLGCPPVKPLRGTANRKLSPDSPAPEGIELNASGLIKT